MSKTILIVSGGVEAADAAKRARDMGLTVVVSDMDKNAPGFAFAHHKIIADVYGPEETAQAAEAFHRDVRKIDGVLCVAADAPVTAALVAERLGLPGISVESAKIACDKLAMKNRFEACGVPVPWFSGVEDPSHLEQLMRAYGPNLVIKPVDSRGSRGVQRLAQVKDLKAAFLRAQSHSPTKRVMVEAYLEGPQVSTESVITGGRCYTPGFSDRNYEFLDTYAPFFIENGGDLPSHLPRDIQDKIKAVVARAAKAMGVENGTVKGDMLVHKGEPYVIELAARLSGGFFCTREIPFNTGVDFIGIAIRVALGETIAESELTPRINRPVIQRYAFPKPGKVIKVSGAESARHIPGIEDVIVTARIGDIIPPAGDKRPSGAMVLATGASRAAALEAANAALSCIEIETQ